MKMICRNCSRKLSDGERICPACGTEAAKTVIISRHSMPPQQPMKCVSREDIYKAVGKASESKAKKELRQRLIVYIIAAAVSAAIIGAFVLFRFFL